ncbi:MAG: hypothetical protein WCR36_09730 [Bacteroidaceae bacterium]
MEQKTMDETVSDFSSPVEEKLQFIETEEYSFNWIWYLIGIIFFIFAFTYLFQANDFLTANGKMFTEHHAKMDQRFVAGDAYNFIIAGTYSTTLTVRALFFALLGGISFLMGKK